MKATLKKIWTEEEEQYIKQNYPKLNTRKVAEHLKRSPGAIRAKAFRIELKKKEDSIEWTEEEEAYLKDNYFSLDLDILSKELGRTQNAIRNKASHFKLARNNPNAWTKAEEEYLKNNYYKKSYDAIAKDLNKKKKSILDKASRLNLKQKQWLEAEEEYLLSLVGEQPWGLIQGKYNHWARINGYRHKTIRQLKKKLEDLRISHRLNGSSTYLGIKDICLLLGCHKSTVNNLRKVYPELKKPEGKHGHDRICFHRKTIRKWLVNNPDVLERHQKKLDIRWLMDILTNTDG